MSTRIKEILQEKKMTVSVLADTIGITRANMSNIVNGKTNPKMETLEKIAKALNVSIIELFAQVEKTDILGIIRVKDIFHEVKSVEGIVALIRNYIKREKWTPKIGEKFWYVTIPDSWDFEDAKPKECLCEDYNSDIYKGNNIFKTEEEAIEMTNIVRTLFGYDKYEKP
ncbi:MULTISPECIES: helix-turn-helix domain-containing protein [Butyricimonas]|uniref:helix-turn-helix domain-containing protein n=1 Tax=Butyricimonas TaxID=574697 RepID=UPI0007FB4B16|nr:MULTISPECIES: helix-turn-helix transcriptional regulator [Butyricimonas]